MRFLLLAPLLFACGEPPRCLIWRNTIEVYGGAYECVDVEAHFASAVAELRSVVPMTLPLSGRIEFDSAVFDDLTGDRIHGKSGCYPFSMYVTEAEWKYSSLAHELAHWNAGTETGDWECNFNDGDTGHADWEERGIYEAIRRWRAHN